MATLSVVRVGDAPLHSKWGGSRPISPTRREILHRFRKHRGFVLALRWSGFQRAIDFVEIVGDRWELRWAFNILKIRRIVTASSAARFRTARLDPPR